MKLKENKKENNKHCNRFKLCALLKRKNSIQTNASLLLLLFEMTLIEFSMEKKNRSKQSINNDEEEEMKKLKN